ncbi:MULTISPECIES: immunity 8 family protein [Emticicia]|uniref:immunity 8 family protein n=1 Tax=Emticicia TaxID=312278 RepID=UPI0020A217A0|nr:MULTISPECIES: immunity 8 family protein [Emticicia]UTA66505.1 immunity 8 family protein [Emticicia sp. 21SJ11W-3]
MRAVLKELYTIDMMQLLKDFKPAVYNNFGIWIRLIVGEEKTGGEESFDIKLCTPQWLIENHQDSDIIFGRHHLIVFEYNYSKIYNKLKKHIENIHGDTWGEIGTKVGRIGYWEFEDYQEYR